MTAIERELEDFQRFVLNQSQTEADELMLEDYICLWRARQERPETITAIQEGLDDLNAGRVRPAEDVLSELRQRLA